MSGTSWVVLEHGRCCPHAGAFAARIRQLAAKAEHRRNIAGFHAPHLADQQARINALLLEMIDALAGLLAAPAPGTGPRGRAGPRRA